MHGGNNSRVSSHSISVPRKVHRPKVVSTYEAESSYPDVDEGYFLHESFGKTVFRPRNWDSSARADIILFNASIHKPIFNTLAIGTTASSTIARLTKEIVRNMWDVFASEGICRTIIGYEFKIDTGTSASVVAVRQVMAPMRTK